MDSAGAVLGDVEQAGECLSKALTAVITTGSLSKRETSALIGVNSKLSLLKYAKWALIGVDGGSTIGDLMLGTYADQGLRDFSMLHAGHATPVTAPPTTTTPTTTPATSTPQIPEPTGLAIGNAFSDDCVVAWPTAASISSGSIEMTMSCQHVPEDQFLFTDVSYGDPHLNVTPATGSMHVVGRIVDISTSDFGYKELVVEASQVTIGQ